MGEPLDLGCFSVSLSVQDLDASQTFYEALGFKVLGGGEGDERYLILSNGTTKIGLFEQMFEGNILTFNPGLDQAWDGPDTDTDGVTPGPDQGDAMPGQLDEFTDVRVIEQRLVDAGIELIKGTESEAGADHIILADPDGNQIMVDQFF